MIHIDRNHLPSPNLISDKIVSWSSHQDKPFDTFIADDPPEHSPPAPDNNDKSLPGPVTPVDPHDPPVSHTSSPASPADGNTASPTRDRSSSLSPAPETGSAAGSPVAATDEKECEAPVETPRKEEEEEEERPRVEQASRQSTPLSELSPPPPDDENEEPIKAEEEEVKKPVEEPAPDSMPSEPKTEGTPSIPSPATPTPTANLAMQTNDPKVVSILELNLELLKICMEFQSRGIPISEPRFSQYSVRLQSNLTWLAAAADHSRQGNHSNMLLPTMDPPPAVEFGNMERIQQIYADLPSIFAKEIARRHQMGVIPTLAPSMMSNGGGHLKRDRSDEVPGDIAMKRRNTGDTKPPSTMPPPPSIPNTTPIPHPHPHAHAPSAPFPLPMTNGIGPAPHPSSSSSSSPQLSDAQMASLNPALLSNPADAQLAASNRERTRQAQIRAAQQQASRQISPPSNVPQGGMMSGNGLNAAAGPSNLGSVGPGGGGHGHGHGHGHGPGMNGGGGGGGGGSGIPDANAQQQLFRILQTPSHPFMQYMIRAVPGFESLPVPQQMQKMLIAQAGLQRQQHAQQQALMSGGMGHHMSKNPMHQQQQQQHQQQQQQMPPQMSGMSPQNMNPNPGMGSSNPFGNLGPNPASSSSSSSSPVPPHSPQNAGMFGMDGLSHGGPGGGGGGGGGGGIDPRMLNGLPPGFNVNNLMPHQRQQLILMQQSRQLGGGNAAGQGQGQQGGGGGGGGMQSPNLGGGGGNMNMNMNASMMMNAQHQHQHQQHQQQMAFAQEQQNRMREQQQQQQQQQRMGMQGSPTHPNSPMPGGDGNFPVLRSNPSASIPGIARSTRSPSDGTVSPMTPRVPPARGSSMGHEDYQRMMQMQAQRGMSAGSPGYNHQSQQQQQQQQQQQMTAGNGGWQGNQNQHQHQAMGMGHAGQQQQQGSMGPYGMSPSGSGGGGHGSPYGGGGGGSIGGGNAPSPSSSQNWGQSHGNYPFAPSPGTGAHQSDHGMQIQQQLRHMSATPAPGQQMQPQNASPSADQPIPSDFDLFNWGGQ